MADLTASSGSWTDARCPILRPWICSPEVQGERRYENGNTTTIQVDHFVYRLRRARCWNVNNLKSDGQILAADFPIFFSCTCTCRYYGEISLTLTLTTGFSSANFSRPRFFLPT